MPPSYSTTSRLRRACARVIVAMIEPLEERQLLSAANMSARHARHAHHVHHLNHERHLRQITVSRSIQTSATTALAAGAAAAPIVRPDHIVVVIEEDRASGAIGDTVHMPYFNQLAASGLVYTNSHGVAHPSLPDYLALYSGSTQGITDNGNNHTFTGPNIAKSLNSTLLPSGQYLSFGGFTESLPRDGDTTTRIAGDPNDPSAPPDLYMRNYNPMAQFTDVGAHGATAITNAQVNKTFASFPTTAAGFASLPTVSFVIPNNLHNTHGSNEQAPYATDPSEYNFLRSSADTWLKAKLDGYLQWAKANNSLLIVTTDEEETDSTPTSNLTTIINGDPDLVVPGTNATSFNHYNVLRTIEDMYGLTPLGNTATVSPLTLNSLGQLSYPGQIVSQSDSTTLLASSSGATVWGQGVTFTATVSGPSGVPTGTVTFRDGTTVLGSGTLNASGQASFTTSALSVSTHAITAIYNGDAGFKTSTSPALSQTVNQASSRVTVTAPAFAGEGQPVNFSVTVATMSPGAGTPTGSVQFQIDGANFGAPVTLTSGAASTQTTGSLSAGQHTFTAIYSGDANVIGGSGSSVTQVVAQQSTSTSVSSSPSPSVFGQGVTFVATVVSTAGGTPTGTVTFTDGTTAIGSASLNSAGQATLSTAALAVASHSITATYSGDGTFATSTSPSLVHQVGQAATATALRSSANPSAYAQSITFTATVTPVAPGSGIPVGTVQFVIDGGNAGAPVALSNGSATSAAIANLSGGAHTVSAIYGGSANFAGSTSAAFTQTVRPANDNFASRTTITGASVSAAGANVAATKETGEPSHAGNAGGKSVWYSWTATSSGRVTIDTAGSSFDTLLAVYTGSSVSALAAVSGGANDSDPAGGTLTSKVTFSVTANTTYKIAVDGFNGASGNIALHVNLAPNAPAAPTGVSASDGAYADRVRVTWTAASGATAYEIWRGTSSSSSSAAKISAVDVIGTAYDDTTAAAGTTYYYWVKAKNSGGTSGFSASNTGFRALAALVNDSFANRITITGPSVTLTASNKGATKEVGEPNHGGNVGGKSLWYTWTAPASGKATIDTSGSNFDTLLGVYTGTSVSALTLVPGGSNDDNPAGGTTTSKVVINVAAGVTYQIAVDGYNGVYGNITLHLNLV